MCWSCTGRERADQQYFKPSVKKPQFVRIIYFSTVHQCWMNVVHIYSTVVPHRHSSFLSKEKGKLFPGLSVGAPQCVLSIEKHQPHSYQGRGCVHTLKPYFIGKSHKYTAKNAQTRVNARSLREPLPDTARAGEPLRAGKINELRVPRGDR